MRLFIAEKPEVARAIVAGLGGGKRRKGYYDCGEDQVTWCYGHMLKLLEPEDYDPRYCKWTMDDLPIVHFPWRRKPIDDPERHAQLKTIQGLLAAASSVVHAGDPDEEGQLLVDEVLAYAGNQLPVLRLLVNDYNTKIVRRQLAALRDNREFAGLSAAAEARCVGDRLYSLNMTRGYTLAARSRGHQGIVSVGRVQTPILGLVVRRCRENSAHRPVAYYVVEGLFSFGGTQFSARYCSAQGEPVDSEGRLSSSDHAMHITDEVRGEAAKILDVVRHGKRTAPPLPYNLLKLQIDASRQFDLKPEEVTAITQVLREKYGLVTYNRSECEYLSEEQHNDAPSVLAAIAQTTPWFRAAVTRADPSLRSRAFDSKKVSAHHAIIPTSATVDVAVLTRDEQRIYALIARAYIAQFWPDHCTEVTEVRVAVSDRRFAASAIATTMVGWKTLFGNEGAYATGASNADDAGDDLRTVWEGQVGICDSVTCERMHTLPPALYTMTSLLSDLTSIAKYIRDSQLRRLLVEKDGNNSEYGGFGTPASRDAIINALFDRDYLTKRGQSIIATPEGEALYDALPTAATHPDMTAVWHVQQKAIMAGTYNVETFVRELVGYIADEIATLKQNGLNIHVGASGGQLGLRRPQRGRRQRRRGFGRKTNVRHADKR